jgi:epoxyqueuosine reductase
MNSIPADLKSTLVAKARELGFALCRVARAQAPRHGESFVDWLAAGQAGDMAGWLGRSREKRINPELVLPGVRSVVVLVMNYWQGDGEQESKVEGRTSKAGTSLATQSTSAEGSNHPSIGKDVVGSRNSLAFDPRRSTFDSPAATGRVARYAWGDDYHDLIRERLGVLDERLAAQGGRQRCYVDTGPVLERDFAAEAGAGWQGKSTMLLHPDLGIFYFLAVILTTLELEPDAPISPRCGSCTACLDACPTGAIRRDAPYHLDARRCISYLTIEHKGAIPEELRPLIGDRIYGCDECLDVCPWNRFAVASREAAFQARPATLGMPLRDYLALDEARFAEMFRGSPILRTKRRGLLRNVCVALGNAGDCGDLPSLATAAADSDPLVVEHARWAIARIQARHPDRAHSHA